MSKFCGIVAKYSIIRRVVVGVLCFMIAAASFSDINTHFDYNSKHRHSDANLHNHSHEVKASHNSLDSDQYAHSHDASADKSHIPVKQDCPAAGEAHLCITAILTGKTDVASQPYVSKPIQYVSDEALSHMSLGLYRPPIFFL